MVKIYQLVHSSIHRNYWFPFLVFVLFFFYLTIWIISCVLCLICFALWSRTVQNGPYHAVKFLKTATVSVAVLQRQVEVFYQGSWRQLFKCLTYKGSLLKGGCLERFTVLVLYHISSIIEIWFFSLVTTISTSIN